MSLLRHSNLGGLRVSVASSSKLARTRAIASTSRARSTTTASEPAPSTDASAATSAPLTHFRVTLRRSAIGLPKRFKATLEALGIHRRMQTVYHEHNGPAAGKILKVKELVHVENVSADQVRTKEEARRERKAPRGYTVVSSMNQPSAL